MIIFDTYLSDTEGLEPIRHYYSETITTEDYLINGMYVRYSYVNGSSWVDRTIMDVWDKEVEDSWFY